MSYTKTTIQQIIETSFDGKKSLMASTCGLAPRVITRLTQDQSLTPQTLEQITRHLSADQARELSLAACRDLLPPDIAEDLSLTSASGLLTERGATYNQADPKSEEILRKLRALVRKDPESRDWLHQLATWIFPNETKD